MNCLSYRYYVQFLSKFIVKSGLYVNYTDVKELKILEYANDPIFTIHIIRHFVMITTR
jgi:hypothetical protein